MTTTMKTAMNKNGYYYDMETNTLHITKAFDRKRLTYGSEEYKIVRELKNYCDGLKIEAHSRATKEKPLSYEMMKKFIRILPTAKADLEEMERQQKMSVAFKSPYKFMERWFNEKYPYYKEMLVKSDNGEVEWDVLALIRQAQEQAKETSEADAETIETAEETVETTEKIVEIMPAANTEPAEQKAAS